MASPSRRLGERYVLGPELASGGMATVHLGKQLGEGDFRRVVAIKRLHRTLLGEADVIDGFLAEAKVAARIRHAHVVGVQDVLRADDELLLVMDYVPGASLSHLLSSIGSERIPPAIASAIVGDILDGLEAAHGATGDDGAALQVVHRDVSPQNVLVGSDGAARLIDFGVARSVARLQQTREGLVKGKLLYLPPEVVEGEAHTVAGDVYSAGCVLWETLVGEPAFRAATESAVMARVLMGDAQAPSARGAPVDPAVDEVVAKAMAHSPKRRFATAGEFGAALRAALPPASAATVRAWMQGRVGALLAARGELVSAFEREPMPSETADAAIGTSSGARPRVPSLAPHVELGTAGTLSAASTVPPTSAKEPSRSRAALLVVALLAVALGFSLALGRQRLSGENDRRVATPVPVPPVADGAAAAENVHDAVNAPTTDAAPLGPSIVRSDGADAALAAGAVEGAAAPTGRLVDAGRRQGAGGVKRIDPPSDCRVPYRLDAEGNRIYKRECLK